ncbi:hypothetical protein RFI_14725 [Reticulomyxa filosa]|uniref:Amino acid transporter transmembrane domain-containing protein n=1 Tax=Reticulomyxa filosa TaxID=46433 RepID=X6N996_RETFI|nr:hypothetical protein RFI_14725 [Reticulomyxa filosa]|eukprot:ETO22473.1 hypothetical protein RFI_14725 [Reticulomyxa filosa]
MLGGFAAHPTVLPIYFEMHKRGPDRFKKCILYGFGFTLVLYLAFAYFGYFTFPDDVSPNLLSSDYRHNPVMLAAAILLCIYVISVVPLFAHAFRKSFAELLLSPEDKSEALRIAENPAIHVAYVPNLSPSTLQRLGKENKHSQLLVNSQQNNNGSKWVDDSSQASGSSDSLEDDDITDGRHKSKKPKKTKTATPSKPSEDPLALPLKQHVIVTVVFVLSAFGVALVATNIGQVNALIGCTTLPVC